MKKILYTLYYKIVIQWKPTILFNSDKEWVIIYNLNDYIKLILNKQYKTNPFNY